MSWLRPAVLVLISMLLALPVASKPAKAHKARRRGRHVQLKEFDVRRSLELQALPDVQVHVPHSSRPSNVRDDLHDSTEGKRNGRQSSFDDIKLRQLVKVYLAQQKPLTAKERAAGGKTSIDPEDSHAWKRLGYVVGMVVKIDSTGSTKRSKKKLDERFSPEATDRFTIQLEARGITTARGLRPRTTSPRKPATLGKVVFATRIVIFKDVKNTEE